MEANLTDMGLRLQCTSPRCQCQKVSSNGTLMRHCPAHDDAHPSLSLSETADKLLWKCQAGCSQTEVTQALKEKGIIGSARTSGSDHRRPNNKVHSGAHIPNGNQGHRVTNSKSSTAGLSTEALAKAKKLPIDLLRAWGVCDRGRDQVARVAIPYLDEEGTTVRVRYRLSLDHEGQRFSWGSGNQVLPYGLNKLKDIRKYGWVLLAEGESDTWTGWLHNVPVLGSVDIVQRSQMSAPTKLRKPR